MPTRSATNVKNDRGEGMDKEASTKEGWAKVVKGSKTTKKTAPYYLEVILM